MFKNPFSFNGRIRRQEYWLSLLCYLSYSIVIGIVIVLLTDMQVIPPLEEDKMDGVFFIAFLPAFYFMLAQGVKRCHDKGNSGWWIIVPFYGFWILFAHGDMRDNEYGPSPKGSFYEFDERDSSAQPIDDVDGDGIIIDNK